MHRHPLGVLFQIDVLVLNLFKKEIHIHVFRSDSKIKSLLFANDECLFLHKDPLVWKRVFFCLFVFYYFSMIKKDIRKQELTSSLFAMFAM